MGVRPRGGLLTLPHRRVVPQRRPGATAVLSQRAVARYGRVWDTGEVAGDGCLPLTAVYDGQCEICQAAVSWIRVLDRRGVVRCVAVQDGALANVHPALDRTECQAQLHVVDAGGRITVG